MLVTGANGTGKTNLLESLHVGTQGFSPRSRLDAQLVRADAEHARVSLRGRRGEARVEVEVTVGRRDGKHALLNGAPLRSGEQLRREFATLVFTPDRLAVVKGGPAVRRAYLDRSLARLLPGRASIPLDYAKALGQRNAALRRVSAGVSTWDSLEPWTLRVVELGTSLVEARREAVALLSPGLADRAGELGLASASLAYDAEPPSETALATRLKRDLERGTTGVGPHLDEVLVLSGSRDLRVFGSQGEQRVAVLSLLLAEAAVLRDRRGVSPLALLDDVLSELDGSRRAALGARLVELGQTVVTATGADALPLEPAQLLEVTPGRVRALA